MNASNDFAEFMRRIRNGDEVAARELVQLYEQELRIIARVRLRDPRLRRVFDSMDVCQSVLGNFFARAAVGQFDLESPRDLMNLLATMVRNKITDHVRAQQTQRRGPRQLSAQSLETLELADSTETPSTIVANQELLGKFRERLTREELQIADMRREGQTWESISATTGDSAEALRKRFTRAIDRVSAELGLPSLFDR